MNQGEKLVCIGGPLARKEFPLIGAEVSIGRTQENTICLPDHSVSRQHALLRRTPFGWVVVNRSSRHGTLVNGREVAEGAEMPLKTGDILTMGNSALTFEAPKPTLDELGSDLEDRTIVNDGFRAPGAPPPEDRTYPGVAGSPAPEDRTVLGGEVPLPPEERTILGGEVPPRLEAPSVPGDLPAESEERTILGGSAPPELKNILQSSGPSFAGVLGPEDRTTPGPKGGTPVREEPTHPGAGAPPMLAPREPSGAPRPGSAPVELPTEDRTVPGTFSPIPVLKPLEERPPAGGARGQVGPPPVAEITAPNHLSEPAALAPDFISGAAASAPPLPPRLGRPEPIQATAEPPREKVAPLPPKLSKPEPTTVPEDLIKGAASPSAQEPLTEPPPPSLETTLPDGDPTRKFAIKGKKPSQREQVDDPGRPRSPFRRNPLGRQEPIRGRPQLLLMAFIAVFVGCLLATHWCKPADDDDDDADPQTQQPGQTQPR